MGPFIIALALAGPAETADAIFHGRVVAVEPIRESCDDAVDPVPPVAPDPPDVRGEAEGVVLDRIEGVPANSEAIDRAKALYEEGERAFEEGRYDAAVELFIEGYRVAPNIHGFLLNIGQAAKFARRCALARHAFGLLLERDDGPRDSPVRRTASAELQDIDACRELGRGETSCLYGVVRGRCGSPYPGAVRLSRDYDSLRFATDEDGRFAVCRVPIGRYSVQTGNAQVSVDVTPGDATELVVTGAEPPSAWAVQVAVDHVHRGDRALAGSTVTVRAPTQGATCVPGNSGGDQLVYARREGEAWVANACGGFVRQAIPGPPRIRHRGCGFGDPGSAWWLVVVVPGLSWLRRRRARDSGLV